MCIRDSMEDRISIGNHSNSQTSRLHHKMSCSICSDDSTFFYECKCGCQFCHPCLFQWTKTQIEMAHGDSFKIKCANYSCSLDWELNDVLQIEREKQLTLVSDALVVKHCRESMDIFPCPSDSCDNYMVYDKNHPCKAKAQCDKCGRSWFKDPKKEESKFMKLMAYGQESFSELRVLFFTTQCSKCNYFIEKNEGCNHMTCKCKHQFCWICKVDWTEPNHAKLCAKNGLFKFLFFAYLVVCILFVTGIADLIGAVLSFVFGWLTVIPQWLFYRIWEVIQAGSLLVYDLGRGELTNWAYVIMILACLLSFFYNKERHVGWKKSFKRTGMLFDITMILLSLSGLLHNSLLRQQLLVVPSPL
eukprot:TRINITY_DN3218_c0_g1_i4.p1 TRINITY_DN3218_c0_g1~~TRINITY_DN3218_c0_g1_i4.p1  ORF type:complete len:359 (+),score=-5.37 TRINITY_DN3218_c0_g1_i4:64-1140(+)